MSSWEFPVTEPIRLHVQIPAGDIRVVAEPDATVATVSLEGRGRRSEQLIEETEVSFTGGTLSVLTPDKIRLLSNVSLDLVVHLPEGSSAELRAASADIRCEGELSELEARTASGDITAGTVTGAAQLTSASGDVRFGAAGGDVSVKTASGDVQVDRADGDLTAESASGDITAGTVTGAAQLTSASGDVRFGAAGGDVSVKTASGDVQVDRADGDLTAESASGDVHAGEIGGSARVRTASGDARIGSVRAGEADVNTVSGDISVAVPAGVGVYLDLSSMTGDVRSDLAPAEVSNSAELTVSCRSISGDIRISTAR